MIIAACSLSLMSSAHAEGCDTFDGCDHADVTAGAKEFSGAVFVAGRDGVAKHLGGEQASSCEGCEWRLVPACSGNGHDADNNCGAAAFSCPDPAILYLVYLRKPTEGFRLVGEECIYPGGEPVSGADIAAAVAARADDYVPLTLPTLSIQPAGNVVTRKPAIFFTEPQTVAPVTIGVIGNAFRVTISPRIKEWRWDFGDGSPVLTTTSPGAAYPHHDITHTYADRAARRVSLTAVWTGDYTIAGIAGTLNAGDVARTATRAITVQEARAQLIGG